MDSSIIQAAITFLLAKVPVALVVLQALGGLVILGQVYVALTPRQDDDALFAKIEATPIVGNVIRAIVAFAPIQRKEVSAPQLPPQA